jgi:hypothetical protein
MMVLVSAKKTGLSLSELREFTMQDLMDFIDVWTGNQDSTKEADQEDIDYFYGHM